jgi:predicted SAM-dependent methyltransferase
MSQVRLHLGCGNVRLPDFTNVDFAASAASDVTVDMSKLPWPWVDSSVDHIYTSHCLEHLPFKPTFEELYRVLKPGGTLHIRVPHANTFVHCMNPTHQTMFAWNSFDPWTPGSNHSNYGIAMMWKVRSKRINLFWGVPAWWKKAIESTLGRLLNCFPFLYERWFMYILQAGEIEYILEKL